MISRFRIPAQFPSYLKKLVLFDRLITGLLWFVIALLALSLPAVVVSEGLGAGALAVAALLAVCLAVNL